MSHDSFPYIKESSCDSLENAVMNLPVKTFTVIESRFSHEIGSVVSGMLQNRWIADLDINLGRSVTLLTYMFGMKNQFKTYICHLNNIHLLL